MGLYRQGKVWYVRLSVNGKLVRKSTGTENKRLADDIFAKMKLDRREGRFFQKSQDNKKTFKDLAEKFMQEYAIKKVPKSQKRDGQYLLHLLPAFGALLLSQVTPAKITAYKLQRRNESAAPKTINDEVGFCRHAFNIAIKELEWTQDNPFTKISMEKLPQPRVRYLTDEEFDRLYQASSDWLKPIVVIAINTGMRQDNVLSLKWQDVDLGRSVITLEHTKNGERHGIPMNATVKSLLSELGKVRHINSPYVFHDVTGDRLSASTVQHAFQRTCKKASVDNFKFHDLRHSFASWLVQKGISLYEVQRLLGHKTAAMTQRYAHLAPDNLRTAINSLNDKGTDIKTDIAVDAGSTNNG